MKKLYYLMAVVLSSSLGLFANPVSHQEALKTANDFLRARGKTQVSLSKRQVGARRMQSSTADAAFYYVFNTGNDNGFVVVSGDDRTPRILGYSDTGRLDIQQMPANLQAWFQGYVDEMKEMDRQGVKKSPSRRVTSKAKRSVPPLITSKWNQNAPYNNLCPTYKNVGSATTYRCATGCVATAMAQVMYYHRWPSATSNHIPSYTTTSNNNSRIYAQSDSLTLQMKGIPAASALDWGNMVDDYSVATTSQQKNAVATLMLYCGTSVTMRYGASSGTSSRQVATALKRYFNYDGQTRYLERTDYTIDEWDNILYDELQNGRPVLYSGYSTGGGHAFVIDGFDGDELYHVNWGWGGSSDGYFLISTLNPSNTSGIGASSTTDGYGSSQGAVVGIAPNKGMMLEEQVLPLSAKVLTIEGDYLEVKFLNSANPDISSYNYGLGYFNENHELVTLFNHRIDGLGQNYNIKPTYNIRGLSEGTYKIYMICSTITSRDWMICGNENTSYIIAKADSKGKVSLSLPRDNCDFVLEDIQVTGSKSANTEHLINLVLRNDGEEYNGPLYLFASTTNEKGENIAEHDVAVGKNKTLDISFSFTPQYNGNHNIWIATDKAGKRVVGQTSVRISSTASSTDQMAYVSVAYDNNNNSVIYGNKIKGAMNLKNNSTATYGKNIIIWLFQQNTENTNYSSLKKSTTAVMAEPGETISVPFEFTDLTYGKRYIIAAYYPNNTKIQQASSLLVERGVMTWLSDGTTKCMAPVNNIKIGNNVVAVDFEGTTPTNITPNNNPNTLYFFNNDQTVPNSLSRCNVIKDKRAKNIVLTDGHDFYNPADFLTENIEYSRIPQIGRSENDGWESIVLPFTPSTITAAGAPIDWNKSEEEAEKDFWLAIFDEAIDHATASFVPAPYFEANIPYLIAVPSASWGTGKGLVGQEITFSAQNTLVEKSSSMQMSANSYRFVGTTLSLSAEKSYLLSADGVNFVPTSEKVRPFRAYMQSKLNANALPRQIDIMSAQNQPTGVQKVEATEATDAAVYHLNGTKVGRIAAVNGKLDLNQLPKGIYVINGKKIVR